jgi:hypothetical protein
MEETMAGQEIERRRVLHILTFALRTCEYMIENFWHGEHQAA